MYTGTNPELLDLQAQITAVTGRVNTIDGVGLTDPTQGTLAQLTRKYEGLKSDLRQAILKLEQILSGYVKTVTDYVALMKQFMNIP